MGSRFRQRTRSAATVSFSLQLTSLAWRSSLNVDRQVFFDRPLFLLPSAGVHSIALRAGRSGAIRMIWPANQNLLSFMTSCSRLCPIQPTKYSIKLNPIRLYPPINHTSIQLLLKHATLSTGAAAKCCMCRFDHRKMRALGISPIFTVTLFTSPTNFLTQSYWCI